MTQVFDWIITLVVLIGVFLLAYSAIRHKDLLEVLTEIKDFIKGKAEEIKPDTTQYANI